MKVVTFLSRPGSIPVPLEWIICNYKTGSCKKFQFRFPRDSFFLFSLDFYIFVSKNSSEKVALLLSLTLDVIILRRERIRKNDIISNWNYFDLANGW